MNIKIYFMPLTLMLIFCNLQSRSCLHPSSLHNDPIIVVYNNPGDKKYYTLRDTILEWYPTFSLYDIDHMKDNLIPEGPISFRTDPTRTVAGTTLKKMLENLLKEIKAKKKTYKDFIVLKGKGFNIKKQAGLLIVKCKKYPFVVKLFMENPRSFIRPYNKGFDPATQFIVGGGITRHALGFTRIKNSLQIRRSIENNSELKDTLDVPRKWFWMPKHEEYFYIRGYNFEDPSITVKVPAIYAIIADAIEIEKIFSLHDAEDKKLALHISKLFDYTVDPHIDNFVIEKETNKIVIIDTEHFPSLVGLKEKPTMSSYFSYYFNLAIKYLKDRYGRLKYERKKLHTTKTVPYHTLP